MKKILLFCLSVGFLFTTTSCLKKQNLDDDNLGPAIAPMELTKTLGAGVGSYSYNDIKTNEVNTVLVSQRIQDSVVQNLEQQTITVKQVSNTVDKLSLDLIVSNEVYSGGQSSQSTYEWPHDFIKNSGSASTASFSKQLKAADANPILMFLEFENIAFGLCYDSGDAPETCHQLVSEDIQYQVPFAAAAQYQCADATNCLIPAKKIQFDRVQKTQLDKDGKPRRTHYTVVVSGDTPFLSHVLQLCTRGIYTITNSDQKILADVCYTVNNYAFGQ